MKPKRRVSGEDPGTSRKGVFPPGTGLNQVVRPTATYVGTSRGTRVEASRDAG